MKLTLSRRLFSNKKKKSNKDKDKSSLSDKEKGLVIGVGGAGAGIGLNVASFNELQRDRNLIDKGENERLTKKLYEKAKAQGTKVVEHPGLKDNAFYHPGRDTVFVGTQEGKLKQADVLSHELGHSQYYRKGRSGKILGKISHQASMPSRLLSQKRVAGVLAAANGYSLGRKVAENEGKQTKTDVARRLMPAALVAPVILSEAAASRRGLKMLKAAGASSATMSKARRSLGGALGTYVGEGLVTTAIGEGSYHLGKHSVNKNKNN